MKFLIVLYATYNDGKADKKSMYESDDRDGAVASFHGYMNTYMKDATVSHVVVVVMDSDGRMIKKESFNRSISDSE